MFMQHTFPGDPHSYVYGSIFDGIFDGHIHTSDKQIFHVEKLIKYYPEDDGRNRTKSPYHSIIYSGTYAQRSETVISLAMFDFQIMPLITNHFASNARVRTLDAVWTRIRR